VVKSTQIGEILAFHQLKSWNSCHLVVWFLSFRSCALYLI